MVDEGVILSVGVGVGVGVGVRVRWRQEMSRQMTRNFWLRVEAISFYVEEKHIKRL